ncbi:hypothetical protein SAMN06265371_10689 [Lutibacter agarilyticus]|uniref:Uncharacterized protein n=1 Tax=Lutibacter agarilyticus TaxID=1109740 RepID=A0A238XJQ5_9FLAO|nr:hypothetical protein [Lutibacter agarilyticus]SNR58811.1 hypothetical protein SAMN06265371_10689 [Lutibacter agarilyticus]
MITKTQLTDDQLLGRIQDCTLDPTDFTHETLLRLTWVLINKYGLDEAIVKNKEIKENYFKTALRNDKFNITLTKAYTEILHHFMERSSTNDFEKLLREFPRLKYNFKNLVKTHYGYNILKEHRKEEPTENGRPILFTF